MERTYPEHPGEFEEVYAEYDEESGLFGVFGVNSGFCYALFCGAAEAESVAKKLNKVDE